METISQEKAIEAMPLEGVERTRFWRDARFKGMECLSATFITHEFAPHAHDTFSIGAIEAGSQISTIKGERSQTGPGDLYLINPDEIHDGHPGHDGYRYRMIYPSSELLVETIEDVTGRSFKGTPSFSRLLLTDRELAVGFHRAHRALEGKVGTLEADESMFGFWPGSSNGMAAPSSSPCRRARVQPCTGREIISLETTGSTSDWRNLRRWRASAAPI